MNALPAHVTRMLFAAAAFLLALAHLGWEHTHGGVAAHHILNRADLPAISNWWGALLIPAITWVVAGRIQRRLLQRGAHKGVVVAGFLGALAWGAALAAAFAMNHEAVTYIFLGAFALSLLVPTYRAEYVLGFVLGMTFTFGAVLPTIIALVIASFSRLMHWLFGTVWKMVRHGGAPRPL